MKLNFSRGEAAPAQGGLSLSLRKAPIKASFVQKRFASSAPGTALGTGHAAVRKWTGIPAPAACTCMQMVGEGRGTSRAMNERHSMSMMVAANKKTKILSERGLCLAVLPRVAGPRHAWGRKSWVYQSINASLLSVTHKLPYG